MNWNNNPASSIDVKLQVSQLQSMDLKNTITHKSECICKLQYGEAGKEFAKLNRGIGTTAKLGAYMQKHAVKQQEYNIDSSIWAIEIAI